MTTPFRKQVFAMLGERYSDKTLVLCPTVFVKLLGGDHKAAILLSQILYWNDRTKDPHGWFYKSYSDWQLETGLSETQIRRIVNGDPRVKTPQRTLRDLGVETLLRKVKRTGAPTLHYRINQEHFLSVLYAFLDTEHCEVSTPNIAGDELPAMPEINADQSAGTLIPQETPSLEESAEDQRSIQADDDLAIFTAFVSRFGKIKKRDIETLRAERSRLGLDRAGLVLERCATRAHSWNYVLRALANEVTPEVSAESLTDERCGVLSAFSDETAFDARETSTEAATPISARLLQPLHPNGATASDVWLAAFQQMELQLDRANFATYLRDVVPVDFEIESSTFLVAVRDTRIRDILEHRLKRTVLRILSDVAGKAVTVEFVVKDREPSEQIA